MTEVILDKMGTDDDFQTLTEFVEQQVAFFRNLQRVLADNEQLRQQVAERDEVIRKQEEALEQQKKGDEWASRVTYEGVVEQIAACEDAKERDEARKLIEPLLKKSQVTQFRRDIKKRVKELNEENGVEAGATQINNYYGNTGREQSFEVALPVLVSCVECVRAYLWKDSAMAVIFCVCRDRYGYADNMSQFERDFQCQEGLLSNTFRNNPYMRLHVDKWKENGAKERVLRLVEAYGNAVQKRLSE